MNIWGYARVSSTDQNEDRQIMALTTVGVPESNIYMDKLSGKDFNRPEYQELVSNIEAGDLLYIMSMATIDRDTVIGVSAEVK